MAFLGLDDPDSIEDGGYVIALGGHQDGVPEHRAPTPDHPYVDRYLKTERAIVELVDPPEREFRQPPIDSRDLYRLVLTMDCPTCGSGPDAPCRSEAGNENPLAHSARWAAALAAQILPEADYDGPHSDRVCPKCGAAPRKSCRSPVGVPFPTGAHRARARGGRERIGDTPLPPPRVEPPAPVDPVPEPEFPTRADPIPELPLLETSAPRPPAPDPLARLHPRVLDSPCPACQALPGVACEDPIGRAGGKTVKPHVRRHETAFRADSRSGV